MKTFLLAIAGLAAATPPASDVPPPAFFDALRTADRTLATIGRRLAVANVALCDRRMPALGWALHGLAQYQASARPTVRTMFGFETPVAVEAIVPGGAAAKSDVRDNDSLVALGSMQLGDAISGGGATQTAARDRVLAAIEALPPSAPVSVTILRAGGRLEKTIAPDPACRSRFEMVVGKGFDASADGTNVQIGERFFEGLSDQEIAVVVAHELAHNILHHRERLDAANISRGVAAEFGRNARLIRQTEDDADRLSVYLLANAGYDPFAPGRFWRTYADKVGAEGLFRSRTHASGKARAQAMDAIAASIGGQPTRPIVPDLIADRDKILN